jgi:hypothetical protein
MTYGLQVTNGDGRTIINSDQEYPNTQLDNTATLTSTESNRISFSRSSNLIFARPNTTTSVTKPYGAAVSDLVIYSQTTSSVQHWMTNYSAFQNPSTTYKYATLSNQTSPATPSEYGLEVFNSSGNTTLLMTEGFENSFDILFSGVATTSTTTFQSINWKTDTDIYVLMNNTLQRYSNFFGTGSFELFIGYIFDTDGSLKYVQNYYITDINGQVSTTFFTAVSNNPYLVVRIKQ